VVEGGDAARCRAQLPVVGQRFDGVPAERLARLVRKHAGDRMRRAEVERPSGEDEEDGEGRRKAAGLIYDFVGIFGNLKKALAFDSKDVEGVVQGSPDDVWTTTKDLSGISKELFDAYYRGRESAFAYKLGCVSRYATPRRLEEIGVSTAPQSFVYLKACASD